MARKDVQAADPAATLAWEDANRRKAAAAAAVAGIVTLGGGLFHQYSFKGYPTVGGLEALTPALSGQVEPAINPRTVVAQFLADHSGSLILDGALTAIAAFAAGYAIWFLMRATIARRPQVPAFARWIIVIGSVAFGLFSFILGILQGSYAKSFIDGTERTREAIDHALGAGPLVATLGASYVGRFVFGLAFVLVCINAMRAGLLTRFMGILGILSGALLVFPFLGLPVVQSFWLVALVPLFMGTWPGAAGTPPAWAKGIAVPWPSSAEVREQKLRDQTTKRGADDEVFEDAVDRGNDLGPGAEPAPAPRSTAQRKRRKRR